MDNIKTVKDIFEQSLSVKKHFIENTANITAVVNAASRIIECYRNGGKIIVFGNGGSAADSQHMAAELAVRFEKERKSLPCIALTTDTSILTAAANDYHFRDIFTRQLEGLACPEDVIIAISTSGNSDNVVKGAKHSQHKFGKAADIVIDGMTPNDVHELVCEMVELGQINFGGIGKYNTFTHLDISDYTARWAYTKK